MGGFHGQQGFQADFQIIEAGDDADDERQTEPAAAPAEGRGAVGRRRVERPAQPARETVGGKDEDHEGEQDGCRFAAVEHFHGLIHQLAEAAGADETHDHRGADGAFPAINRVRGQFLRGLRNQPIEDGQRPAGAVVAQRPGWGGVDRFEDFSIDLGQHAAVSQAQRQHAGRRAEAKDANENERPDQLGNAAQDSQQTARDGVQRGLFAPGTGGQIPHRHGDQEGQRHAGRGDGQRLERRLGEVAHELGAGFRRQKTGQEVADDLEVARVEERARLDPGGLKQRPEDDQRRQRADQAAAGGGVAVDPAHFDPPVVPVKTGTQRLSGFPFSRE